MIGAEVRAWLVDHTPLEPTLLDGAGFESMVCERVASASGGNVAAYLEVLRSSPGEVDRLIAGVAVGETWLFRYPRSFDLLVEVLERLRAQGRSGARMVSGAIRRSGLGASEKKSWAPAGAGAARTSAPTSRSPMRRRLTPPPAAPAPTGAGRRPPPA